MALKAKIEAGGQVPAGLEAHYTKQADGSFLLDAEGVEDVTGLKSTLEKLRGEKKEIKTQLSELLENVQGVDLAKAKEALAKLKEIDEKKLLDAGKIDELVVQRVEAFKAESSKVVDKLTKERDSAHGQLEKLLIDVEVQRAAIAQGVRKEALDDLPALARVAGFKVKDGKAVQLRGEDVVFGADGVNPLSITDWVKGLAETKSYFFADSTGGGGKGGSDRGGAGEFKLSRSEAKDPAKYRMAKQNAEKAGQTLQIID